MGSRTAFSAVCAGIFTPISIAVLRPVPPSRFTTLLPLPLAPAAAAAIMAS